MFDVDMEGKPSGLGSSGYLEISVPFTLYSLRERNKHGSVPGGRTHPDIGFKAVLSYAYPGSLFTTSNRFSLGTKGNSKSASRKSES